MPRSVPNMLCVIQSTSKYTKMAPECPKCPQEVPTYLLQNRMSHAKRSFLSCSNFSIFQKRAFRVRCLAKTAPGRRILLINNPQNDRFVWDVLAFSSSGRILNSSWAILGYLGAILGHLGPILGHLGAILGPSWSIWGSFLAKSCLPRRPSWLPF